MTVPKRRPGRPPLAENDRSITVGLTVPLKLYDELYAQARRYDVSIPEVIRRRLRAAERRAAREKNEIHSLTVRV